MIKRKNVSSKLYFEGGGLLHGKIKRSESNKPLITVITSTLNAAKHLPAAIQSIREQNYQNIEYIIIDGASSDGTLDILRANEDVIDYWVSEPDKGIYDAWNKGVKLSRGDWVAFLGADDIYLEGAMQAYVALINSCSDESLQFVSSQVNLTSGSKVVRSIGQSWDWRVFRKYMNVAHVGSLHHKSLFVKFGLFDVTYKICGDYEFLLRPRANLSTIYLNSTTVNMSISGISNSNFNVFSESARAKVVTGGRNFLFSQLEKYWAIIKWLIRSRLFRVR